MPSSAAPLNFIDAPADQAAAPTLALALALLDSVKHGRRGPTLRIYRPEPTLAFGARDKFLPGFSQAVEAARVRGFAPVLRGLGGRAAAYHRESLVIDHLEPDSAFLANTQRRFTDFGLQYVDSLRRAGVDARFGEIPGEYCAGEHSVNAGGRVKIIGTAQRVVRGGWLFSSSIVVENPAPIRSVLTDVYAALGLEWEPATGGSISEVNPEVTTGGALAAILAGYRERYELVPDWVTEEELRVRDTLVPRHAL